MTLSTNDPGVDLSKVLVSVINSVMVIIVVTRDVLGFIPIVLVAPHVAEVAATSISSNRIFEEFRHGLIETSGLLCEAVYQCQQINTEERKFQNYPHFGCAQSKLQTPQDLSKDP
jgi:hypothetical protein